MIRKQKSIKLNERNRFINQSSNLICINTEGEQFYKYPKVKNHTFFLRKEYLDNKPKKNLNSDPNLGNTFPKSRKKKINSENKYRQNRYDSQNKYEISSLNENDRINCVMHNGSQIYGMNSPSKNQFEDYLIKRQQKKRNKNIQLISGLKKNIQNDESYFSKRGSFKYDSENDKDELIMTLKNHILNLKKEINFKNQNIINFKNEYLDLLLDYENIKNDYKYLKDAYNNIIDENNILKSEQKNLNDYNNKLINVIKKLKEDHIKLSNYLEKNTTINNNNKVQNNKLNEKKDKDKLNKYYKNFKEELAKMKNKQSIKNNNEFNNIQDECEKLREENNELKLKIEKMIEEIQKKDENYKLLIDYKEKLKTENSHLKKEKENFLKKHEILNQNNINLN